MEFFFTLILVVVCAIVAMAQSPTTPSPRAENKPSRPVKVSLLSNYYGQDGSHSAVNGGIGSQQLNSYTQEGLIFVPIKDSSGVKFHGGVDHYTSASLLDIDKYQTSASSGTSRVSNDETRGYGSISFELADKKNRMMHSPSFGFSTEYDVLSFNGSYGISKFFPKKNITYNSSLGLVYDRWMVIYPGEFRSVVGGSGDSTYYSGASGEYGTGSGSYTGSEGSGGYGSGGSGSGGSGSSGSGSGSGIIGVNDFGDQLLFTPKSGSDGSGSYSNYPYPNVYATPILVTGKTISKDGKTYPVDHRYSLSFSNSANWLINKKMNAMAGVDLISQWGLLSTPFHRVYFNDGVTNEIEKEVRIEKLPSFRLKTAAYGRLNIWISPRVMLRTYARYYYDTWDIHSITLLAEMPLKATPWLSFVPYYRFYWQTESEYFKPYGRHEYAPLSFYTSDFDLSGFIAHKAGMTVRVAPINNIISVKSKNTQKQVFALASVAARYSYYHRSDGLSANIASVEINFEF